MRDRVGAARPRPTAGRHISLSLARLPATDQAHRIGTLFVNNGGPGNSVIDFMHGDVHDVVPAAVQARFDIVGFDPRGVGESTPVRCFADADAQQAFFGELPPFPVTPDEVGQATSGGAPGSAAAAASATASCSTTSGRPTSPATSICSAGPSATSS